LQSQGGTTNLGAIIGGVLGGIGCLVTTGIASFFAARFFKTRASQDEGTTPYSSPSELPHSPTVPPPLEEEVIPAYLKDRKRFIQERGMEVDLPMVAQSRTGGLQRSPSAIIYANAADAVRYANSQEAVGPTPVTPVSPATTPYDRFPGEAPPLPKDPPPPVVYAPFRALYNPPA
jgi:hypothetical protein